MTGQPPTHSYDEQYFQAYSNTGRTGQYYWARRFYANLVLAQRKRGRLLEIGCGLGHLLARLEPYFDTYGIDVSDHAVERASLVARKSTLKVLPVEAVDQFGPGFFDVIIAIHVFEHLADPESVIRKCARVLGQGGILLIATPNLRAPLRRAKGDQWYGFRDPTHISLKNPSDWLALLERNSFRIKRAFGDGMWDVPYVKRMPLKLQKLVFGAPAAAQALLGRPFLPVAVSESLICLAEKQ